MEPFRRPLAADRQTRQGIVQFLARKQMNLDVMKILDLFAGVGGLSLGAARAGFEVAAAVENDHKALASHKMNFPNTEHIAEDIANLRGSEILSHSSATEFFGVIGGPPCQGFSTIGRRDRNDPRNHLFHHFLRIVTELHPAFFILENVPGILSEKNFKRISHDLKLVSPHYNISSPLRVTASNHGAATTRSRVFFVGLRKDHGYDIDLESHFSRTFFGKTTSVGEALFGLPENVNPDWRTHGTDDTHLTAFGSGWFYNKIHGEIPMGVGSHYHIQRLKKDGFVSGCVGTQHTPNVVKRFQSVAPGMIDKVSKAPRLSPSGFCPTLRAGTGSDRGSYQAVRPIHPSQPRVITPREAARLQGFPDWFQLDKSKWHSFRQIGNSVSPIVSESIMRDMRNLLSTISS